MYGAGHPRADAARRPQARRWRLVDNVPIGEVLDLCKPDIVIAVNVGSPLFKPRR
jgi:hypothetical protein